GHAAVQDRERLGADVIAQLEILQETQPERLKVIRRGTVEKFKVPAVDQEFALFHRTEGVLPLVPAFEHGAFNNAAAGKTEETGMQIRERLHHVRAQPAGPVL